MCTIWRKLVLVAACSAVFHGCSAARCGAGSEISFVGQASPSPSFDAGCRSAKWGRCVRHFAPFALPTISRLFRDPQIKADHPQHAVTACCGPPREPERVYTAKDVHEMRQGKLLSGQGAHKRKSLGEQRSTTIDRRLHVRKIAGRTAGLASPEVPARPVLRDVRVILIGTKMPVSLGMVARAAASFEVGSLVFVAPRCSPLQPSAMRASKGALQHSLSEDRLSWTVADTLQEGLQGCEYACGMTRLDSGADQADLMQKKVPGVSGICGVLERLREGASNAERTAEQGTLALVFGREDIGFVEGELEAGCITHVCEIPMSDRWGTESLSLAQAVPIVLARLFEYSLSNNEEVEEGEA